MSADMNITAAISMSSGDPRHRQVLQQTWSSVTQLVNFSGEDPSFPALLNFLLSPPHSKGSIEPRQLSRRRPSSMPTKTAAPSAAQV